MSLLQLKNDIIEIIDISIKIGMYEEKILQTCTKENSEDEYILLFKKRTELNNKLDKLKNKWL